jgi:hypothetical protein
MLKLLYQSLLDHVLNHVRPILLLAAITLVTGLLFSWLSKKSKIRMVESRLWLVVGRMGRQKLFSLIGMTVISFAISAVISFKRPPKVTNMDEFSYLLAGDTLAHGRLTNPTHPFWIHFESLHIIQKPTYASKYPPGPGLFLALGQLVWSPVVGAWLSTALACTAIYWMLLMWVPPRWAIFGGLITVAHPLLLTWSQSFSGASVAACGGALIIGSWRGFVKSIRLSYVLLFSLGAAMLALTRPFEGFVLTALVVTALIVTAISRGWLRFFLKSALLPITLISLLPLSWLAYYNWRVTGNAFQMPYAVHEATYGIAPTFLFQNLKPEPQYNFKEIRSFHEGFELQWYLGQQSLVRLPLYIVFKLSLFIIFYSINLLLAIPLVTTSARQWKKSKAGPALLILLLFLTAEMFVTWLNPHYVALSFGLCLLIFVTGLRTLNLWCVGNRRVGAGIVSMVLFLTLASLPARMAHPETLTTGDSQYGYKRAAIADKLNSLGGHHLIFVRYGPTHFINEEWVYNDADIDNSAIVWAREVNPPEDKLLLDYFKDRRVWVLYVDTLSPEPLPYYRSSSQ